MGRKLVRVLALVLAISLQAYGHHSMQEEFDISRPITLNGRITGIEWTNPHCYLLIAVTEADGKVHEWHVQGDAPNQLKILGWSPEMLNALSNARETVVISGYLSRHNVPHGFQEAWVKDIKLSDGRSLPFQRPIS